MDDAADNHRPDKVQMLQQAPAREEESCGIPEAPPFLLLPLRADVFDAGNARLLRITKERRMSWREDLQQQIDLNNSMRAMSLIRIGDEVTEYAPCLDGAGRPREIREEECHE